MTSTPPVAGRRGSPSIRLVDEAGVAAARRGFLGSTPRHAVIDEFLTDPVGVFDAFPELSWAGWHRFTDEYQRRKQFCSDVALFPDRIREVFTDLASPAVLTQIESITGITGLIPDPHLDGGGMHVSPAGGILAPHTDFHAYERLGLFRRINLIIYLTPDWGDGGAELQLFADRDATQVVASVTPELGRCLIFETDDRSVHGFTTPVAEGRTRRSLAVYYYTAADTDHFAGDGTTVWGRHGEHRGAKRLRMGASRMLVRAARVAAHAAYRIDPNRPKR